MSSRLNDIQAAYHRIKPHIHKTPVLTSNGINEIAGCSIYFKCENLQKIGAFKARGGLNAVLSLDDETRKKGITTHSSGNHAQAIAFAAQLVGSRAWIVMPKNAPKVKVSAVRGYGAEIIFCENTLASRESTVNEVIDKTGAYFIHPYNDERIICGQATASLELLEQVTDKLDSIIAPVGGGGLLSGTALATHFISPSTRVYGAEPEGADDAIQSFGAQKLIPQTNPDTIADGLRTSLGDKTFSYIVRHVTDILPVSDSEIISAMELIWQRMKVIIEPSSAVPLAAILRHRQLFGGHRVGIILSGGNVDISINKEDNKLRFK